MPAASAPDTTASTTPLPVPLYTALVTVGATYALAAPIPARVSMVFVSSEPDDPLSQRAAELTATAETPIATGLVKLLGMLDIICIFTEHIFYRSPYFSSVDEFTLGA
jgi:hypothetical protein